MWQLKTQVMTKLRNSTRDKIQKHKVWKNKKKSNFYKIKPEEILIIHDELDIIPGKVKLKLGGGHGGHNGVKDISNQLGSNREEND